MKEKTVLSLSYGRIIIKPAEKLHGLVPESFETYQIVNPGDIILRTTDLQNDHTSLRVGMVRDRGIITSAYLALKVSTEVSPDFGFQLLNVWDTSKAIYGYGSGLRQNLDFSHFKRMPVAVPPPGRAGGDCAVLGLGERAAGAGDPGEAEGDRAAQRAEAGYHPPRHHSRPRPCRPAQTLWHPLAREHSAALGYATAEESRRGKGWDTRYTSIRRTIRRILPAGHVQGFRAIRNML
jgi:hypothetical protein